MKIRFNDEVNVFLSDSGQMLTINVHCQSEASCPKCELDWDKADLLQFSFSRDELKDFLTELSAKYFMMKE
jgi:hypothetical protein